VDANIVTYNIQWKEDDKGNLEVAESYVELGSLDPALKEQATFIDTAWG